MTRPARPRRNRSRSPGVPSPRVARASARLRIADPHRDYARRYPKGFPTLHTPFLPVLSKREMARLIRALYGVMANAEKSVRGGKGR